jgi:hypothetical protein
VSSEYCVADVSPSTGVSVSVAADGDCVVKFTSNSTVAWTRPSGISTFEMLVVAGGGGGGGHPSGDPGGGGGGGVVHVPAMSLSNSTYEVQVGVGGIGNDAGPCGNPWFSGRDGGNSIFGTVISSPLVTAHGGAGGGGACDTGRNGGSGGGAHCGGGQTTATKGVVDASIIGATLYGNAGGSSAGCGDGAGGGGGALTAGQDGTATKAGNGGEGISLDTLGTGTPVVYGSGGGGASGSASLSPGLGGTNGGNGKQGDGSVNASNLGVDGTGSGGGAQFCPSVLPCTAGKGGDGVILLRYEPTPIAPVNISAPVVSGSLLAGSTLSTTNGTWSGTSRTYTYRWERAISVGGSYSQISGANTSAYIATSADVGYYVRTVVTATNGAGAASSIATAIGPITAPATTTTTSTSTTSTTVAPFSSPETVTTQPVVTATTQPVAQWQISRVTKETKSGVRITATTTLTTTTVPQVPPTTAPIVAPTSFDPPSPSDVQPGEATVVVNGEPSPMSVSRRDDQLFVSHGNYASNLAAIAADGSRQALDGDGNIRLQEGDSLSIIAAGFASNTDVELWMFSEPSRLGVVRTDSSGTTESLATLPMNVENGDHRIVIAGTSRDGKRAELTVGIRVGAPADGVSTAGKILIALPLLAAVFFALVLPARRRRKVQLA